MKKCVVLAVAIGMVACSGLLQAQVNPTGSLVGVVTDPSGAAIPGATVVVTETATHRVLNVESDATGRFVVANLSPSVYDVSVSHTGFRAGVFHAVQIVVGQTYTLNAKLQLGEATQSVEVQAGQEVIETQQTSIADQVTGKQITQVPITSRNTEDLAMMEPGAQTTTTVRGSAFEGLPGGALNITFDGISAQDQVNKSSLSSSLFAVTQPRLDDVQEFSITEAANDASQSGEGAVQIAMVSNKGGNAFHGGGWEYLRNDALDANNYFSNQSGLARQRIRLDEYGYKFGGPILKDKLFFFTDLDAWDFPAQTLRTATILTPGANGAATGSFTYVPTTMPTAAQLAQAPNVQCNVVAAGTCTANLMAAMGQAGFPSTVDPIEANIIGSVANVGATSGVQLDNAANSSFNTTTYSFNSGEQSHRYYPDLRLDYTINKTNSLEYDYHYAHYFDGPDVLNSADAAFPIAPYTADVGAQISDRNLMALAWRWQATPSMNNELRVGYQAAPTWFDNGQNDSIFPTMPFTINNGGTQTTGTTFIRASVPSLMTQPFRSFSPEKSNAPVKQLNETLSWLHGNHSMTFGGSYTNVAYLLNISGEQVAAVTLGMSTFDPADTAALPATSGCTSAATCSVWGSTQLPDMKSSDLTTAQNLWAVEAGRVTKFSQTINANPTARAFQPGENFLQNMSMNELGLFATDNWRLSPTLTFNYGLRWEFEGSPKDNLDEFYVASGNAYGVSGFGNLFSPGTETGAIPTLSLPTTPLYNGTKKDFAPNVGFAWTPGDAGGWLEPILGKGGQSVFRGAYSIAYDREGVGVFDNAGPFDNPGQSNSAFANAAASASAPGLYPGGSIQLSSPTGVNVAAFNQTQPFGASNIPINLANGQSVFYYDSNLRPAMVQSWSVGWQRQLNSNSAIEIRYVGNHATGLYSDLNLNETNIFENGFLTEFNNAVKNLNISGGSSFADTGLPGQVPVPILTAAFTGSQTGSQTNKNFTNAGFINDLTQGLAGSLATSLNNFSNWSNLVAAGYPTNFWMVDPNASGSFVETNINQSTYNGLQMEYRRRMQNGLQLTANYTYSHSLGNGALQTLRDYTAAKAPVGSDLRHVFKLENLYELPFGSGRRWKTGSGLINNVFGGWDWDAITRWQSGDLIHITSGLGDTVNGNDPGVTLVGTSVASVASQLGIIKQPNGQVFFAPTSLLGGGEQKANVAVIAPCETAGAFCSQPYFYGPNFFKADWGLVKNTNLGEKMHMTIRANVLNAFNNINFSTPSSANTQSNNFMRVTSSYSDFSFTQDPGGRVIELQFRLDF